MRRQRGRPAGRFKKAAMMALAGGVLLGAAFSIMPLIGMEAGSGMEGALVAEASAAWGGPPVDPPQPAAEVVAAGAQAAVLEGAALAGGPAEAEPAGAELADIAAELQPVGAEPAAGPSVPPDGSEAAAEPMLRAALTFDDGPDGKYTPMVLDILQAHGVKATFFVVGKQAERYPEVLRRIHVEGHEIGSHSFGHANMEKLTEKQIAEDLSKTDAAIAAVTGEPPLLFRAPYGAVPQKLKNVLADSERTLVGWNVDPRDWAGTPKDEIVQEVTDSMRPDGVILLHSFGGKNANLDNTIEALPVLIELLHEAGYTLGTVSELGDDRA